MRSTDFREVFEFAPDAMFILDMDGIVVDANRQASEFFGYERDEIIGASALEFMAPEHRKAANQRLHELRRNESQPPALRTFIRKDGSRVPGEVFVNQLTDENGDATSIVSAVRDASRSVTRQRMQEEAAARMQALGGVASGVAHDFNNILATIVGFAELARESVDADSDAARDLDRSLRASKQASRLVQQILSFGRQATGAERPFDVEQSIVRIIRLIRSSLHDEVKLHFDSDHSHAAVHGDEARFQQIIMNLCGNAGRAIGDGSGSVVIRVRSVQESGERTVRITVVDDGPGVPAEIREHIFDPFFSTRAGDAGTGLGLSLVKSISESFGGSVVLDPTESGASFTVSLPALSGAVELDDGPAAPEQKRGSATVLVLDDDEAIVEILGRLLRRAGYSIIASTDPLEAIQLATTWSEEIGAILTDFRMPGIDGLSFVRRIRSAGTKAPVIIITAVRPDITALDAQELGIDRILGKPLDAAELTHAVSEAIEQNGNSRSR